MSLYTIKTLGPQDRAAVADVQQTALEVLPAADLYFPLSETEIDALLGKDGLILGACAEDRLVAFQAAYFPGPHPDNLGRDLGLPASEWERVAHLEASAVDPDHRGNGLQKRLASALMQRLRDEGRYRHICATTAPGNIPSILNKLSNGMLLLQIKPKYNGSLRSLFHKNLLEPAAVDTSRTKTAPLDDVPAQIELLRQGFAGCRWIKNENRVHIVFGSYSGNRPNSMPHRG